MAEGGGSAGSVALVLAANAKQFKSGLTEAANAVDGLADKITSRIPVIGQLVTKLNAAALSIAASVTAINAVSIKAAMSVETPIMNVATVWDEAGQRINGTFLSLGDASQQVIDLSTQIPQSAAQLAEGLYNVASSGFQGTEAMEVLDASARAASAGITDTETSARAITGVLNAFGLSATDATDVSDTMFQVVNRGVITFEELAQNMGDIAPIAASAGISFAEAGAAMATMTLSGLPASEAATSLQGAIRGLIDPNEQMIATLSEFGYESGAAAVKSLGLRGVLELLMRATDNQADAWLQLFEDSRAARGAMAVMAQDGRVLTEVSADVTDQAARQGATQEALGKQSQSLSFQLNLLKNSITAIAANFGKTLLPVAKVVIGVLQGVAQAIAFVPGPFYAAAAVATNLAAALGALALVMATRWITARVFAKAMDGLRIAMRLAGIEAVRTEAIMKFLSAAKGPVTVAFMAITAMIYLASDAMAKAKQRAQEMVAEVQQRFDLTSLEGLNAALAENEARWAAATEERKKHDIGWNPIRAGANAIAFMADILSPLPNSFSDAREEEEGFRKESERVEIALANAAFNTEVFADQTGMTEDAVRALAKAQGIDLTQSLDKVLPKLREAAGGANELEIAYNKIGTAVTEAFTTKTAWQEAEKSAADQLKKSGEAAREAIQTRYRAEKEGHDRAERDERDSLDRRTKMRQDALEQEHDDIVEAIDDRYEAYRNALDDEARTQKQDLDRKFRTEKDALDDRLKLLDDAADKRKTAEERRWEAERDEIQFMIDATFGAEREGWKDRLVQQEDAHTDQLDLIDTETEHQKRVEKNALDDRQQQEQNSLDDRLQALKDNLDDREETEKEAETLRYNNAKTALDNDAKQFQDALDEKYRRLGTALDDRQKKEEDAADARYNSAEAKNKLSLEQYQQFLDEQVKKANQFNQDMAIIASRGGADVLDEIAKMEPAIVAQLAAAGPEEFLKFLESIRLLLAAGKPVAGAFSGVGARRGIPSLTGPARPGLADGGIFRFADGGEYRVAQVAAAGAWRVWAEPETGGEAYIPLALSKRARSTSILGQVAEMFGYGLVSMANGGIVAGGGRGGTVLNMPISIDAKVAAGVDPDAVGRAIAVHTRRAVDEALDAAGRRTVMRNGGR